MSHLHEATSLAGVYFSGAKITHLCRCFVACYLSHVCLHLVLDSNVAVDTYNRDNMLLD